MKKIVILSFSIALISTLLVNAGSERRIDFKQLPVKVQGYINQHFPDVKVIYAEEENDSYGKTHKVRLANGCKIEFDETGLWEEIECKGASVPFTTIPQEITDFIKENHEHATVIEIERGRRKVDVKLNNGLELEFDLMFKFIRYDD